jgi:hypothetical protein
MFSLGQKPTMKMNFLKLCFVIIAISGLHAIKIMRSPSIKGVVFPENKVKTIWAVQGTDSTEVRNDDGNFSVKVKPGVWKIIINTKESSYQKNTVLYTIQAIEGKNIDLGEINLQ